MTGTIHNGAYTTGIGITNLATQGVARFSAAGKVTSATTIPPGTITTGIELDPAFYTNPVVIEPGAVISNTNYNYAVYRDPDATTVFTIQNSGTVTGSAAAKGVGIYFAPGGTVTNTTAGVITGYTGVKIAKGAGTVVNDGSILSPRGISGIGVDLLSGGSVTNAAGASIAGYHAVKISGGAGTVVNYGSISENGGRYTSVELLSGGSVTNAASASITGDISVEISGGAGTVVNDGIITGALGVDLLSGGSVTNAVSASITEYNVGVNIDGSAGILLNYGTIRSSLDLGNPSPVNIYGTGTGTNEAGGTISGVGRGLLISGGSFTNATSGTITGATYGALIVSGTLTNAGSIVGNNGTAVSFSGIDFLFPEPGGLVLEPGFAFTGLVVADSAVSDTLELGSASSAGTVSGLGTEFIHFSSLVFDPGAKWTAEGIVRGFDEIPGIFTITGFAAGDTIDITAGGTIPATITGPGRLQLDNGAFADTITQITGSGTIAGVGSVVIDAGATLQLTGGGALPANISGAGMLDLLGAVPYSFAGNALGTAVVAVMGGALDITSTGFANARTLVAEAGGAIDFTGLTNLSGTRLAGGTYIVDAGSTMQLPNNATVATLAANLTLSGAGSIVESLDTSDSKEVALESTLTTIAAGGALGVLAGRSYATANAIADAGSLTIGGAFSAASLDVAGGGRLDVASGGVLSLGAPLSVAGTATNAGTIAAAVKMASGGGRLVLVPGFKLGGPATGGGAGSALELAAGPSPGLLNALGAGFTNFGTVTVDAGAAWTVDARATALGGVTIIGDSA